VLVGNRRAEGVEEVGRGKAEEEISSRRPDTGVRGDLHAGDWGRHGSIWRADGEELLALPLYFGAGERIVGVLDRGATDAAKRTLSRMSGEECQADAIGRAKLFNFVRIVA
jgi:hypothetical protein